MHNYILTENKLTVHLDMPWRYRIFQSEINELGFDVQLPMSDPGYIKLNESYEIFPVTTIHIPQHDPLFEHLIGPTYVFYDEYAEASFEKEFNNVEDIRLQIKGKIAEERYNREIRGVKVTIQDKTVLIDTSRDTRNIFIQKLLLMADNEVVNWKFNEGWLTLTKLELQEIITLGAQYIQSQFDWEKNQIELLDNTNTVVGLREIYETVFGDVAGGDRRGNI